MRELWIQIEESASQGIKETLLKSSKSRCNAVVVGDRDIDLARSYGVNAASSNGGDIQIVEENHVEKIDEAKKHHRIVCLRLPIRSRMDEAKAVEAVESGVDYVIVSCPDWKIIPLENLISISRKRGKTKILAEVHDPQEALTALETLELGADGVVLKATSPDEVEKTSAIVKKVKTRPEEARETKISLSPARVVSCKPLSMGSRVCIDTCELMELGEGILVGCQSSGLFLVQAEVEENPHVAPRPFRVNAGPVSLYTLTPDNRTRYLSELKAGDEVLIVGRDGECRTSVIGRVKIEKRPLILVEAEVDGDRIKAIVQNAETIRFVTSDGSTSVSELKSGDEVLVYHQLGGRHFGVLVNEEAIVEQ